MANSPNSSKLGSKKEWIVGPIWMGTKQRTIRMQDVFGGLVLWQVLEWRLTPVLTFKPIVKMENAQRELTNFSRSSTETLAEDAQKRRKSKLVDGWNTQKNTLVVDQIVRVKRDRKWVRTGNSHNSLHPHQFPEIGRQKDCGTTMYNVYNVQHSATWSTWCGHSCCALPFELSCRTAFSETRPCSTNRSTSVDRNLAGIEHVPGAGMSTSIHQFWGCEASLTCFAIIYLQPGIGCVIRDVF